MWFSGGFRATLIHGFSSSHHHHNSSSIAGGGKIGSNSRTSTTAAARGNLFFRPQDETGRQPKMKRKTASERQRNLERWEMTFLVFPL
jgi:hypothetical protein